MRLFTFLPEVRFLITFLVLTGTLWSQQCDQCSHPRVALYDAEMLVPRPSAADSIAQWWTLKWPMLVARNAIRNEDPSRDCISWYDGASLNARDLQGDTLKFGNEYFNLPPSGEVNGADYLLTGTISGNGGAYTLTLILETAVSREVALSQSAAYGFDELSQETAGQTLAAAFSPLFQKIRDYEINKRNSDVTVAIRDMYNQSTPEEITITPAKTKIDAGEAIDVDIEMIDCDGVPLGSREIFFTEQTINGNLYPGSTGGTVEPSSVITDANGQAKVKFTADNTTGLGQITAYYVHEKPCGRPGAFTGNAPVVIGQPPEHLWLVNARLYELYESRIDSTWSGGTTGSETLYDKMEGTAFISALVENGGNDSSSFFFVAYEDYGDEFEAVTISGSLSQDYYYRRYVAYLGTFDMNIRIERYSGPVSPGNTGFEFHYPNNPSDLAIVAQCGGSVQGSLYTKSTNHWPEFHWDESSYIGSNSLGAFTEFNADECSISKSGFSYTVSGSRTVNIPGSPEITRTINLNATIRRLDSPTSVESVKKSLPATYNLYQNYPNPFNPVTIIKYSLPAAGLVSLKVFDILGSEVAALVNEAKPAGEYEVEFDAAGLSGGIYFYRIQTTTVDGQAGNHSQTLKMTLLK